MNTTATVPRTPSHHDNRYKQYKVLACALGHVDSTPK